MLLYILSCVLCVVVSGLLWLFRSCPKEIPSLERVKKWKTFSEADAQKLLIAAKGKWQNAMKKCPCTHDRYLIIGGGFLGTRLIEALLQRGETKVRVVDVSANVKWAKDERVEFICANMTSEQQMQDVCKDIDTVFLTAAVVNYMDYMPHQYFKSFSVNVLGTEHVVAACKKNGVKRLIHTSTSNTSLSTTQDKLYFDEKDPYVTEENSINHYGLTKALSEQIVLTGNSTGLQSISIRPCSGIFGAKDHLIVEPCLKTKTYMFLGFKMQLDWVFVDNVAYAHLLAERSLIVKPEKVAGQSFCVSNNEPMTNVDFRLTIKNYYPSLKVSHGPRRLIFLIACILDTARWLFKNKMPSLGELNNLSLSAWKLMEQNYVFITKRATQTLDYLPVFSVDEGIQLSIIEHTNSQTIFN